MDGKTFLVLAIQDESGSVAIRTVELDDLVLRGVAVQHREVFENIALCIHYSEQLLSFMKVY